MNYDTSEIATVYDAGRALTPEGVLESRAFLAGYIDGSKISLVVDLGCGTGRFSELLAGHFGARVVAVEPSQKMVDQARRKLATDAVMLQRAFAEALPLADGCVDLVFMSMIYHHLTNPAVVARECRRVLRQGGYVCMRNGTRESDFPHRHFFPAIRPLIDSELPYRDDIGTTFAKAGFVPVIHEVVTQTIAPHWQDFVDKSATRADSFLARIADEDFRDGMIRLSAYGRDADADRPVTQETDWFIFVKQA